MANFGTFCNFSNIFLLKWSKTIQNGLFWHILQLFQYFPTEVVQNNSECPILATQQLLASILHTEIVQIDSEWPILHILQIFQYFPTEVVQIDSEWPILAVL